MKKNEMEKVGIKIIIAGLFLLLISALLLFYNLWDNQRAKMYSESILEKWDNFVDVTHGDNPLYLTNPDMEMPTVVINGHSYIGRIDIQALGLSLPIMSEWSYANLKLAPCRYSGSTYQNNLIVAGHNYNSHFGTLKNLTFGDCIRFTDIDGNLFEYKVVDIEQLLPTDVEEVKNGEWDFTLFTCTLGGNYRIIIRCIAA